MSVAEVPSQTGPSLRPTAVRFSFLAGFLLAAFGLAGTGAIQPVHGQTSRPELLEVSFEGNQAIHTDTLRKIILNRATNCRSIIFKLTLACRFSEALRTRRFLEPRQVSRDSARVSLYYWTQGYREARVDTAMTVEDEGARLAFTIDEGRPVRIDSISFRVYDNPIVENLLSGLPVRRGDPFSTRGLEAARDTLTRRLYEAGYFHAEILRSSFIATEAPYSARVGFEVDPGPRVRFGEIIVEGNVELDRSNITRMVPFQTGQLFRPRLIEEAQRNIYSLDLIRNATVQAMPSSPEALDTIIPIRVQVAEGDVHRVRTAAGWSTADCFNAEARWASRNFMGGARRLTVTGRVSNILSHQLEPTACYQTGKGEFADLKGRFSVELVQPSLFSSRNSLVMSAFAERESLPDVFIREAFGLSFGISRILSRRTTATLSWQPQLTRLAAAEASFCNSFLICTKDDISVFVQRNWLAPVGIGLNLDRSNNVLNPTRGWSFAIEAEHASRFTGSDFSYNRLASEVASYIDLSGDVILAFRVRGGAISEGQFEKLDEAGLGIIHPQKRFYAGGSNSVRGFGEGRLGPRVLRVDVDHLLENGPTAENRAPPACTPTALATGSCDPSPVAEGLFDPRPTGGSRMAGANLELRFPLVGSLLQGAVFADAGQVWGQAEPTSFGDIEVTPGLGLRYFSPIGPIRLDVGYRYRGGVDLGVITQGIRAFDPMTDKADDRIRVRGPGGNTILLDWVESGDLRVLNSPYLFGANPTFWDRLQLHFSIGQAF